MGFDQLDSDSDRNDAKPQVESKTDRAAGAAQEARGSASGVADKATSAADGRWSQVTGCGPKLGGQAPDMGGQVYKQAADAGRYAGQQVQEQPLAALLIAGCIGAVIGYLIGRDAPRRTIREYAEDVIPRRLR